MRASEWPRQPDRETHLSREGLLAAVALEGPLAGVDAPVALEVRRSRERRRADVAPKRLLARVRPDVCPQLGRPFAVLQRKANQNNRLGQRESSS